MLDSMTPAEFRERVAFRMIENEAGEKGDPQDDEGVESGLDTFTRMAGYDGKG